MSMHTKSKVLVYKAVSQCLRLLLHWPSLISCWFKQQTIYHIGRRTEFPFYKCDWTQSLFCPSDTWQVNECMSHASPAQEGAWTHHTRVTLAQIRFMVQKELTLPPAAVIHPRLKALMERLKQSPDQCPFHEMPCWGMPPLWIHQRICGEPDRLSWLIKACPGLHLP